MPVIDSVDIGRALGAATRQELLAVLQQHGEQCVGDVVRRFGRASMTPSAKG